MEDSKSPGLEGDDMIRDRDERITSEDRLQLRQDSNTLQGTLELD